MFLDWVFVGKTERALVFERGDFKRVLGPGGYWVFGPDVRVERYDMLNPRFDHGRLKALVREPELAEELIVIDNADADRAVVLIDGRVANVLGPGVFAYWKGPADVKVERFNIDAGRFDPPNLNAVLDNAESVRWINRLKVEPGETALVFRNGARADRLGPGQYAFWKGTAIEWKLVDLREQTFEVAGQEIMTSDKVTLRVNMSVTYQVADAEAFVGRVADPAQALYREAQFVLRAAVGGRTLDQLLGDKESIGGEARQALASRAEALGVVIRSVGVRDIILPGDMRLILNQVIEAEKRAQANLIKRREETAAARSQANTAKILAENPALVRIRELELVQEILAGTNATFVLGEGDLVQRVGSLISNRDKRD